MFKQCVVTAVNYGPLIDVNAAQAKYREIDLLLAEELKKILNIEEGNEEFVKFATDPVVAGGL